jgi:hypothetical protein
MNRMFAAVAVAFSTILGTIAFSGPGLHTGAQESPAAAKPNQGFDLHVDAKLHFPGDPDAIAHHFCKNVSGGMIECLLFASEEPDARIVGVEVIVTAETWASFPPEEQMLWHYHREEIPVVEATMPELTAEEAAPIVEQLMETYGKLYLLWDPTVGDQPIGSPTLSLFHQMHP